MEHYTYTPCGNYNVLDIHNVNKDKRWGEAPSNGSGEKIVSRFVSPRQFWMWHEWIFIRVFHNVNFFYIQKRKYDSSQWQRVAFIIIGSSPDEGDNLTKRSVSDFDMMFISSTFCLSVCLRNLKLKPSPFIQINKVSESEMTVRSTFHPGTAFLIRKNTRGRDQQKTDYFYSGKITCMASQYDDEFSL